jgi:hypothetical protein
MAADRARARRLPRASITLCSIRRYSHRISSPFDAHRRPRCLVTRATRRAAMADAATAATQAPGQEHACTRAAVRSRRCARRGTAMLEHRLGRRSRRSTVVPRRRAAGAATPLRELSGRARTRRWAAMP